MKRQKRIAAIHDISGFGRCSLTVALPIISAAGIEVTVMPTAVLSTHTGGFVGFTYRDLTEDMRPMAKHWKSLNLEFDSIYSGFLGSFEQIEIVKEFIDEFKTQNNLIIIDPAMADDGKMYSIFDMNFAREMATLCAKADIIVPNMTEAAFMLGENYTEGPYTKEYVESILCALCELGPKQVVLTGVWFDKKSLGAASYDKVSGKISYAFSDKIDGSYHGTGDVYASALLAALMNGAKLSKAIKIAVDFTYASIIRTKKAGTDVRFGVDFENGIPELTKQLGLI